jgi:hypothetical protein
MAGTTARVRYTAADLCFRVRQFSPIYSKETIMQSVIRNPAVRSALVSSLLTGMALGAHADVVTEWNIKAGELIVEAKLSTPPAIRVLAIVQTAVHDATSSLTAQDRAAQRQRPPGQGGAIDATVAAAHRTTLVTLLPAQRASIEHAYQGALARIVDDRAKTAGIAAGEQAAAAVLAKRANDGTVSPAAYRPHATAGVYVPTASPAVPQWSQRKPWLMTTAAQFRPDSPPALTSEVWARDYNEVKALGSKTSDQRSTEQVEMARFWEYSLPPIYFGVVHSVARLPGRSVPQNARLFAAVAQAMDDAMISVFDAKYYYQFWRPVTAIRNGDVDGNDATEQNAAWTSFVEAPMHPEYPSAHSILAGAVGAVLQAEVGEGPKPVLSTTSPTANGATRRWTKVDDFTREVGNARVYEGIHYRTSTEVGAAMGKQIGELAVATLMQAPQ